MKPIEFIEYAKSVISHRATMMGLDYFPGDILSCNEDGNTIVWLRRYKDGYCTDKSGDCIVDENGDRIPKYKEIMWLEYSSTPLEQEYTTEQNRLVRFLLPRLVCQLPELVMFLDTFGVIHGC